MHISQIDKLEKVLARQEAKLEKAKTKTEKSYYEAYVLYKEQKCVRPRETPSSRLHSPSVPVTSDGLSTCRGAHHLLVLLSFAFHEPSWWTSFADVSTPRI